MRRSGLVSALFLLLAASPAAAAVIGTTGAMTEIAAPASTVEGNLQSNTQIFVFAEQASLTLGSNLSVDVATDGAYDSGNVPGAGSGSILAGTAVDSYFIHLDRVTGNILLGGSVTFDTDILGVIVFVSGLDGSNGLLGAGGTSYTSGVSTHGLEFAEDSITLSGSTLTVSLREQQNRVDQLRVIVAGSAPVIPEPNTALLLGGGLLALAASRRARR